MKKNDNLLSKRNLKTLKKPINNLKRNLKDLGKKLTK